MKYVLYTKEILLLHRSDKAIRRSALFHWVPNVNSCSLFIIFPAGDSLNQSGSSSFQRPWTKYGITQGIRKTQAQHRNLKKKLCSTHDHYLFLSPNKLDQADQDKKKKKKSYSLAGSADLTEVSASIIVNLPCQERVFGAGQRLPHVIREDPKDSGGTAEIYQSQMARCSPLLWHVEVRHCFRCSQQTC